MCVFGLGGGGGGGGGALPYIVIQGPVYHIYGIKTYFSCKTTKNLISVL